MIENLNFIPKFDYISSRDTKRPRNGFYIAPIMYLSVIALQISAKQVKILTPKNETAFFAVDDSLQFSHIVSLFAAPLTQIG